MYHDTHFFIKKNGEVWAAGTGTSGILGTGNTNTRVVYTKVNLTVPIKKVVAGSTNTAFISENDELYVCGQNNYYQLGDGTNIARPTPVALATDVVDVAVGDGFIIYVKKDGTVYGLGINSNGTLGLGHSTSPIQVPTQIPGLSNVKSVSSAFAATFAITYDGKLFYWGYNSQYVFTNAIALNTMQNTPIQLGNDTDWKLIACNAYTAFALKNNGDLYVWGDSASYVSGLGTITDQQTPALLMSNVLQVDVVINGGVARKTDNTLWGWGSISYIRGDGSGVVVQTPMQIATDVTRFSTSSYNVHAIKSDGKHYYWGTAGPTYADGSGGTNITSPTVHPSDATFGYSDLLAFDDEVQNLNFDVNVPTTLTVTCSPQAVLDKIKILGMEPPGTKLRVLFSLDQANWEKYDSVAGEWGASTLGNIETEGMTMDEVWDLESDAWTKFVNVTFYVSVFMVTTDPNISPSFRRVEAISRTAVSTPTIQSIKTSVEEVTIEGRMQDLEHINAINMAKLQFKSNSLLQSEKYELHDLVVDTFETADNVETTNATYDSLNKEFVYDMAGPGVQEVILPEEILPVYRKTFMLNTDHEGNISFEYSLDGGAAWKTLTPSVVIDLASQEGVNLKVKAKLKDSTAKLRGIALSWV